MSAPTETLTPETTVDVAVVRTQPLNSLRPNVQATVSGFSELPANVQRRLEDLGIEAGAPISLLRKAPMGDPCIYRVRDYDLCLRNKVAGAVMCDTCEEQL